jgi:IclR family acetate operon transcriptional repressor
MLREHVSRRATHPPQDSVSRGVQSVSRAISLIASLVEADAGLTLSELARSAGLSMSTTHRLLRSLCDGEILCRDLVTERFIPGPLLMRLARSSIFNGGFAEASHILQGLTDRTRETASYGVRDGDSVLVLSPSSHQSRCASNASSARGSHFTPPHSDAPCSRTDPSPLKMRWRRSRR